MLGQLLAAMEVLGVEVGEAWRLVAKVALDGCPDRRRLTLEALVGATGRLNTRHVVTAVGVAGKAAVSRDLEDLTAHGLAELLPERGEYWWRPTNDARARWAKFFGEPEAVEPDDRTAAATEVAELEAAFNGAGIAYDPLDEDF